MRIVSHSTTHPGLPGLHRTRTQCAQSLRHHLWITENNQKQPNCPHSNFNCQPARIEYYTKRRSAWHVVREVRRLRERERERERDM